jgi:predicted nucleotidyltransferase component of viral defense system
MIRKQDILDRAAEWQLRPEVVEKDYVLGWLLAALHLHAKLSATWIFKGGTCIKKCYFETYRFSEDLDFTLLGTAAYTEDEILNDVHELLRTAAELSGVEFPADRLLIKTQKNKQGETTFQARISYRGPLAWTRPDLPRILFDITRHEPVLDEPVSRPVFHPYPDT